MENFRNELVKIRMFAFLQGLLLTVVSLVLAITRYDMLLMSFLVIIAWGGFFVITLKIGQIIRSSK